MPGEPSVMAAGVSPAPPLPPDQSEYRDIPLDQLRESPDNPRRIFNPERMAELEASVLRNGILAPLLVRPHGDTFQIAAGHRRYRVAKKLKLQSVPCRIKLMTDADFLEILTIENCQREDVHPTEEGEGFHKLIKRLGYTPDLIAEKIGKEAGYVYRRLQLANLIEEIKKPFLAGALGLSHAVLLARIGHADQKRALKDALFSRSRYLVRNEWKLGPPKAISTAELDNWIRREVYLDLSSAPWDKADASMQGGACTTCPKQTGSNARLFDDFKPGEERCSDRPCYAAKEREYLAREINAAAKAGKPLVQVSGGYMAKVPAGVVDINRGVVVGGKKCPDQQAAIVAKLGPFYNRYSLGQKLTICLAPGCPVHRPHSAVSVSSKEERARIKRQTEAAALKRKIETASRMEVLRAVLKASDKLSMAQFRQIMGRALLEYSVYSILDHRESMALCAEAAYFPLPKEVSDKELRRLIEARFDQPRVLLFLALIDDKGTSLLAQAAKMVGVDPVAVQNRTASLMRAEAKGKKAAPAAAAKKKGKS